MDSVFGIGFPELVLILLIAGIVMGPQRIRQTARWLGLMTVRLQRISREFTRQLNAELDSLDTGDELRGAAQDVQELRRQVDELKQELRNSALGGINAGRTAVNDSREALRTILPPDLVSQDIRTGSQPSPGNPESAEAPSVTPHPIPRPIAIPDDPE
jgi:Tat protein translocase TatB subunit